MIGTILKDLARALSRYTTFQAKQALDRKPRRVAGSPRPIEATADAPPMYTPIGTFDWQILGRSTGLIYEGGPSLSALDSLVHVPRFVLDVGCSSGDFASAVKKRFPTSRVWGIEMNEAAAKLAAPRIDRVLAQKIEDVDWKREGVQRGEIDTVFLFDVLEHTYDPWTTLLALRNLVSKDGQLVVSIPNARNVLLMQDLVTGHWRYRRAGLLDITHIRFFTKSDMYRMFYQTGYRVIASAWTQCALSAEIFEKHQAGRFPKKIELDSASITVHSREDLESLCAVQHVSTLQPVEYSQLSPAERKWIDDPHPPTKAYSAGT